MDTLICSSDFSRARQTAEIVRAQLGASEVIIAEALRERCFGEWEGSATGNYARVWAADETDPGHADGGVEPAAAVLDRTTALIVDLERRYSGRDILLVSRCRFCKPASKGSTRPGTGACPRSRRRRSASCATPWRSPENGPGKLAGTSDKQLM
jgi:hypothetical protein